MKAVTGTLFSIVLVASTCLAAKLPTNSIRGEYVEARTADVYTGPCFAMGEVEQTGKVAVMGWHIDQGSWQGVELSGLSVVGAVRAEQTLGDYAVDVNPAKAVIIVDQKATPEQQIALREFAQHMAGSLLNDVVRMDVQPITFTVNDMNATLQAGNMAKIATRAMHMTDQICQNEVVWYPPLSKVSRAMPAYTTADSFQGQGLGETWSYPLKRASFVATFDLGE
jgi:hypothetical protein